MVLKCLYKNDFSHPGYLVTGQKLHAKIKS